MKNPSAGKVHEIIDPGIKGTWRGVVTNEGDVFTNRACIFYTPKRGKEIFVWTMLYGMVFPSVVSSLEGRIHQFKNNEEDISFLPNHWTLWNKHLAEKDHRICKLKVYNPPESKVWIWTFKGLDITKEGRTDSLEKAIARCNQIADAAVQFSEVLYKE